MAPLPVGFLRMPFLLSHHFVVHLLGIFVTNLSVAAAGAGGGGAGPGHYYHSYYHEQRQRLVLKEDTAYVELTRNRLAVYHGPFEECSVLGNKNGLAGLISAARGATGSGGGRNGTWADSLLGPSPALKFRRVVVVDRKEMRAILAQCEAVHGALYKSDPEAFLAGEDGDGGGDNLVGWDRKDDKSLAIYNRLEKKRRRQKQRNNSIWGWNVFNRVLIMPGTKWCGQGDVAEHYNDLGYHSDVDKCCR